MSINCNKDDMKRPLLEKTFSLDPHSFVRKMEDFKEEYSPLEKWRKVYFQPITEGSLRASIMCLLCVTVGTSLLSLPYTMRIVGVILCVLIFFICAGITQWTLNLISDVALKEGTCDYEVMVERYYGKNIVILTIIMCLINNLGSIVAWNIFISNLLSNLLDYFGQPSFFISTEYTKFLISLLIVLFIQVPVCMHDSIGKLHVLSQIGCAFILYVILVSIGEFPHFFKQNFSMNRIEYFNFNADFIQTFCIFFFAFGNHSTIMNALNELTPKTEVRVKKLVNYTSYSEIVIYIITMFVGYFSTFEMTNEIYINRDYQSVFMIIGKFLYILVMICNICLYFYMVRPYLEYVFDFGKKEEKSYKPLIVTIFVLTSLMTLSFSFSKVTILISLLGATSQVYLIFIVPILLYVKSFEMPLWKKILYWIVLFCVILMGVIFLVLFVVNQFFQVFK